MGRLILAINPGSTSTKFAIYREDVLLFVENIAHPLRVLTGFDRIGDQFEFRKNLIIQKLRDLKIEFNDIKAVVGRGGLLKPIKSGIYEVNECMRRDLMTGISGEHASNLGGLIAYSISELLSEAKAFIVDPVVVDEMEEVARVSGHPEIERRSIFHALNQKAVARLYAGSVGKKYEELNLIIAHMGGGVSIGGHRLGRVVDVNNGYNGDGPFSPERSGGLPAGQLAELCFSGKYSIEQIMKKLSGEGGMVAYLGTNDFREVCKRAAEGDEDAKLIKKAAAYQCGKEIGALSAVLHGEVDAIILTGGLAYQKEHTDYIEEMVGHIARVVIYPGEDELKALSFNGLMALNGEIEIKTYK